jgi:hypothetical protein
MDMPRCLDPRIDAEVASSLQSFRRMAVKSCQTESTRSKFPAAGFVQNRLKIASKHSDAEDRCSVASVSNIHPPESSRDSRIMSCENSLGTNACDFKAWIASQSMIAAIASIRRATVAAETCQTEAVRDKRTPAGRQHRVAEPGNRHCRRWKLHRHRVAWLTGNIR